MDLFDLVAKITLDSKEYENGIRQANDGAASWGNSFKKAGAVAVAAIGAATVAVGALTKKAVQSYAEYEQLAGGVKKLYGNASDELMKYAEEGYKTSGMSANKYMELATSFSAALINSLGGDTSAAAKQTDVAMRAISDNFNTFGGDITNVQNAFQGFAKQNYTMLDNLKLGYGGTKTEMERLIADANAYAKANGMAADLSIDSFSDIVTAIDLVQQKQGIAGTTAKEAATTIEGSLNMTKAAWENLVAGFANPDADLGKLMDNLVVAIVGDKKGEGLLNQIIPAIERALKGISKLIEKSAPIISKEFPKVVKNVLPSLIKAATSVISGLVKALPAILQVLVSQMPVVIKSLVTAITQALPMIAEVAPKLILTLADGISKSLPTLIPAMVEAVLTMVEGLLKNVDKLIQAAIVLIEGFVKGIIKAIPLIVKSIPKIITAIVDSLAGGSATMISAGIKLIGDFAKGLWSSFKEIPSKVTTWVKRIPESIKNGIGNLFNTGWNKIIEFKDGLISAIKNIPSNIKAWAESIRSYIKSGLGNLYNVGWNKITDFWNGLIDVIKKIPSNIKEWAKGIPKAIKKGVGNLWNIGVDLINGLWKGIAAAFERLWEWLKGAIKSIPKLFKKLLGISSPSKVFKELGQWIPKGLAIGIEENMGIVQDASDAMADAVSFVPEDQEINVSGTEDRGYGVEINIYATPQQDERKIAEMVQRQLVLWEKQRRLATI